MPKKPPLYIGDSISVKSVLFSKQRFEKERFKIKANKGFFVGQKVRFGGNLAISLSNKSYFLFNWSSFDFCKVLIIEKNYDFLRNR